MHETSQAPGAARGARLGLPIALFSALAFGGSGIAAKPLIQAGLEPLEVTWLRAAGAAVVLLPLAWRHRALVRTRPGLLAGYGLLAVAGVQACYFAALARIPVGVALLIEYLAPALVLCWVRFVQRRRVTRAAGIGVVLAVGGLACVVEVWSGLRFDALGLLFALGAACSQVGYFVLSDHGSGAGGHGGGRSGGGRSGDGRGGDRRGGDGRGGGGREGAGGGEPPEPLGVIAYGMLLGAVLLTALARPWDLDWGLLGGVTSMNGVTVPAFALLAWIVLVSTVAAYLSGVVSIRMLSPQIAGVVACLEAVVATVGAWVLLGEHLEPVQLAGGAVVLLGAFVAQRSAPGGGPDEPVASSAAQEAGREGSTGTDGLRDGARAP